MFLEVHLYACLCTDRCFKPAVGVCQLPVHLMNCLSATRSPPYSMDSLAPTPLQHAMALQAPLLPLADPLSWKARLPCLQVPSVFRPRRHLSALSIHAPGHYDPAARHAAADSAAVPPAGCLVVAAGHGGRAPAHSSLGLPSECIACPGG